MMVKLNMLVCLSILGFTFSIFESCDCNPRIIKQCIDDLKNELNCTATWKPTTKSDRVKILKKMGGSSLSVVAKAYIEKLEIKHSELYDMLRNIIDPDSYIYNVHYNGDTDTLYELIKENVDSLSENQLSTISSTNFNLTIKTFCKAVNTEGTRDYIPDLYKYEDDE